MKIEGIIISTTDYMESSKIVNAYTKEGKLGIRAKGILNPKRGNQTFATPGLIANMVLTDTKFPSLTEFHALNNPFNLTLDIKRIKVLGIIIDIIKSVPDDVNHELLFEFIKKTILALETVDPLKVLCVFAVKMLYTFGVAPSLKACISCGNINVIGFNVKKGGAVCNNCGKPDSALNTLKEYYYDKKDYSLYSDADYDDLIALIKEYYQLYVPARIKFDI